MESASVNINCLGLESDGQRNTAMDVSRNAWQTEALIGVANIPGGMPDPALAQGGGPPAQGGGPPAQGGGPVVGELFVGAGDVSEGTETDFSSRYGSSAVAHPQPGCPYGVSATQPAGNCPWLL